LPKQGPKVYNYDQVFLPDNSQKDLFKEIKPFVQSALDGENTCIFAYGQTGAGKTYTMEGPDSNYLIEPETGKPHKNTGILPRIAEFMQNEAQRYQRQFGQEIIIEVSALEIYCENIRDLLYQSQLKNDQGKQRYIDVKTIGNKVQAIG
jgi:kinesin family member C1